MLLLKHKPIRIPVRLGLTQRWKIQRPKSKDKDKALFSVALLRSNKGNSYPIKTAFIKFAP